MKKSPLKNFTLIISLLLLGVTTFANAGEKEIRASLKKNFPNIKTVEHVVKTPYAGLFEVLLDGQLIYTDAKGEFVFNGSVIEAKSRTNLTEARSRILFAIDFDELPLELAIKTVRGNGKRKIAQFTDPNCSFCKRLEKELVQIDDITIYSFLFPIFNGSDEIVRNVLCSKNPAKTWDNWMLRNIKPATANCVTETEKVKELGRKFRVTGTPNLIFANGIQNPGYLPAAELEKRLNAAKVN
ncbi:MAG: DsbC family protein [Gallionella sp.]